MKKIFIMMLIAALALTGAAFAEAPAVDEEIVHRFCDTWVADGYTAEIWYDATEGGFLCDMVINDTFCEYRDCQYDPQTETLNCEGGIRFHSTYDQEKLEYTKDVVSEGLTAAFTVADDRLTCVDSEGLLTDVEFLRLDDAEEQMAGELAENSKIYTNGDMKEAFMLVENEFSKWEGCEMHDIRYAGDECVTEEHIKWLNEVGGKEYKDCLEILTDFHSPVEGGGAWEADTEYRDYEWWLARTDGGNWELVTWGY